MALKSLLSKKISQEGVQHSPPAGTQGQGLQQDGEKVQGDLVCRHCKLIPLSKGSFLR